MILIHRTYTDCTPESVEAGEHSDTGFLAVAEEFTFRELVRAMCEHPHASSTGRVTPWTWFSSESEIADYRTGRDRSTAIHFARENPEHKARYWAAAARAAGL